MKLDPALFFVSITAFMTFFTFIKKSVSSDEKEENTFLRIIILTGILLGFAFSIKVTSLMLILGILWSVMNVWMPKDSGLLHAIALSLLLLGIASFFVAYRGWGQTSFVAYMRYSVVLILAFFVGLSPWIIKNTSEVKPWQASGDIKNLVMQSILSGSGAGFQPDFTRIMSAEEYKKRYDVLGTKKVSITISVSPSTSHSKKIKQESSHQSRIFFSHLFLFFSSLHADDMLGLLVPSSH